MYPFGYPYDASQVERERERVARILGTYRLSILGVPGVGTAPYILYGAHEHVLGMNFRVGLFQHFFYFLQQLLP